MIYLHCFLVFFLLLVALSLPSIPVILETIFDGYWILLELICVPTTVTLLWFIVEFARGV